MFRNLFFAAVLAGLAAGLVMSAIQQWRVIPLILQAETYEGEGHSHGEEAAVADHTHEEGTQAHTHDEDAWAPADGFERIFYTVLSNVLIAIGFALVIGAISILAEIPLTLANGILWGLAGFAAFQFAPAYGLAPELPGMPAADLVARQAWWWSTVIATGLGIAILAKFRSLWAIIACVALVAAPHVFGAPQPPAGEHSDVPAHLASAYAAVALGTGAVFWLILGPLQGWLLDRFSKGGAA